MAGRLAQHSHSHGSVFSALWDKLGIAASTLCLIDCIVLPIVSTALMSVGPAFAWAEKLHWVLLPLIGLTAGMAFYHSWKAHRSYLIVASGALGFLLLALGELFEGELRVLRMNWVSIAGSAFLIGAHVRNLVMHLNHKHGCTVDHGAQGRNLFGQNALRDSMQPHASLRQVAYEDVIRDSMRPHASLRQVAYEDVIRDSMRPHASLRQEQAAQVP